MDNNLPEKTVEERLPWHKPEVERLNVSLDTRIRGGSVTDGVTGSVTGFY
jgi:hypothetical protein